MGIDVLEGLQHPQGLIDAAAHGQEIDGAVADHAIGADDEQAAQGNAGFFIKNVVVASNVLLKVGDKRVVEVTETAILAIGLHPGQVAELAIYGYAQHFGVAAREVCVAIGESGDFRGAHEGEVQRIEEQHHILAVVVGKSDLLKFLIHHGGGGEVRSRQANESGHGVRRKEKGRAAEGRLRGEH